MKKICAVIMILSVFPFLLCSCFETQISEISLSKTEASMTVGDSLRLYVTVKPDGADKSTLSWTSSDSKILSVNDGRVKAKKAGEATVSAKTENGLIADCKITVVDKQIQEVVLDQRSASVTEGKKIQLTASVRPYDAPTDSLKWQSADEKIATVDSEGFVSGVSQGEVSIICSANSGKSAVCKVTVKSPAVTNPSVLPTDPKTGASNPPFSGDVLNLGKDKVNTMLSTATEIGSKYKEDFIFYDSSFRKLTDSELTSLSKDDLQLAINEIYARHGRPFKSEELRKRFKATKWYIERPTYSDSELNEIESYNIGILSRYR